LRTAFVRPRVVTCSGEALGGGEGLLKQAYIKVDKGGNKINHLSAVWQRESIWLSPLPIVWQRESNLLAPSCFC
jgi:hypothetical protein